MSTTHEGFTLYHILVPLLSVLVSMLAGFLGGACLSSALQHNVTTALLRRLPPRLNAPATNHRCARAGARGSM